MLHSNPVSAATSAVYNNPPPPAAPLASDYWDSLTAQQLQLIITELSQPGCWNLDAMELAPFIYVYENRLGNYALRIEDSDGHEVLFLTAPSGHAKNVITICQSVNEDGLLSYTPAIQGLFIPVSADCANNSLFIALEAARYGIAPDQISCSEIAEMRRILAAELNNGDDCLGYIRQHFRHWITRSGIEVFPYRGTGDHLEYHQLPRVGFTITARGREVHHQLPQLRECLKLIDKMLSNVLADKHVNPSALQPIIAQYLGIDIAEVTAAMTEQTHSVFLEYQQVIKSYLTTNANQFLLGENADPGSLAQAFTEDEHRRIIFNSSLKTAPFLQKLIAVAHEKSHMMETYGTSDIFYVLQHGLVDDISRSSEMFAAMQEENRQAFDQAGFEAIILARFNPIHISSIKRMLKIPLSGDDISLWESAIASVLDNEKWAAFCALAIKQHNITAQDLSVFRRIIDKAPTWRLISQLSGVEYTTPRQLLHNIYADRTAMWKLLLQNADSFILFLFVCGQDVIRDHFDSHHYEHICTRSNSTFSLLSDVSSTPELDYLALKDAESLTVFQFHLCLQDLADFAVSTDTREIIDISVPPAMPGDTSILKQFLKENAAKMAQTLFHFATTTPGIMSDNNTLLFLLILDQALRDKELSAKEILKIILAQDSTLDTPLCNAVAEPFWRSHKIIVWQQLIRRCFDQIDKTEQKIYLKNFLRSAQGITFLQQLDAQLGVVEREPQHFTPIIRTLDNMLKQGIIPANYEVGLRSRKLTSQLKAGSVDAITLKSTLAAIAHPIFSSPPDALTIKELLSGLARLRGWYIAHENADGDTINYFDPQGNDISQQHQILVNNELVLVVTADQLTLNQQTAEGFYIIHSTERPDTNSRLFDAVLALQGPSQKSSAKRNTTEKPGIFNHLNHTDKVNKHADKIINKLDKLLHHLNEGKKSHILHIKQESPITRITTAGYNIKTAAADTLHEAIIIAILANIDTINEIIAIIKENQGVDKKLKNLTSLSRYLQSLYSDTEYILNRLRNRVLQDKTLITHASQIKESARKSIKYTNQTHAAIYDLTGGGNYTDFQLHIQRRQNRSAVSSSAITDGLLLAIAEIMVATPTFSQEHQQRDRERDFVWQVDRAERDEYNQQLKDQLESLTEQLEELQAAQLQRKQQPMPPLYDSNDYSDEGNNSSAQSDSKITTVAAAEDEVEAATSVHPQVSVAESQPAASHLAAGIMINRSGSSSVTLLQSPARTIQPQASGNSRIPHLPRASGGRGNFMSFLEIAARQNVFPSEGSQRQPTLRIRSVTANQSPAKADERQPFPTLRIRSLTRRQQEAANALKSHHEMVVNSVWSDERAGRRSNTVFARVKLAEQAQLAKQANQRLQQADWLGNIAESRIPKAQRK
ncbi:hypothetical protein N5923_12115 [Erwiniaceae bacterium BAC15a-03b]|uniref:Uncharacterized protein n=1 Tax=Winslowiella arboricola TaxID=2978220 RepID=A0A9J6PU08_9GAMM|nr:hypothetical protein [Winslowiella arboricola]MCU5772686.1 hypothetical protein [Winslowiella arboricola]MCU5778236.1 hypothetical protein [Winslowiella arboricola]